MIAGGILLAAGCASGSKHTATASQTAPPSPAFGGQVLTLSGQVHLSGQIKPHTFSPWYVTRARKAIRSEARRAGWGRVAKIECVGAVVLTGRTAGVGRIRIRGALCGGDLTDRTCIQWAVEESGGTLHAVPLRACPQHN